MNYLRLSFLISCFVGFSQSALSQPKDLPKEIVTLPAYALELAKPFFQQSPPSSLDSDLQHLFQTFKSQVAEALSKLNSQCEPSSEVQIGIEKTQAPSLKKFASEIVSIQNTQCGIQPNGHSLDDIGKMILSDDYQKKAFKNIQQSHTDLANQRTCQMTSIAGFGKSKYCYRYEVISYNDALVLISFGDFNDVSASTPLYLRWSVTILSKDQNGVRRSSITMGRGPSVPFSSIVRSFIASNQEAYNKTLQESLLGK